MLMAHNEKAIQNANASIGLFLSKNQTALGISKSDRAQSKNFHGEESEVQVWRKASKNRTIINNALMVLFLLFISSMLSDMQARMAYSNLEMQAYNNFIEQSEGWEWIVLEMGDRETRNESYPAKQQYYSYPSHADYRVAWDKGTQSYSIYDNNGTLVRIAWLVPGDLMFENHYSISSIKERKVNAYNQHLNDYLQKCNNVFLDKMQPLAKTKYRIKAIKGGDNVFLDKMRPLAKTKYGFEAIKGGDNEFQIYKEKNGFFDSGYTSELKCEDEAWFNDFLKAANADTTVISIILKVKNIDNNGNKKSLIIQYVYSETDEFQSLLLARENLNMVELTDIPYDIDCSRSSYIMEHGVFKEIYRFVLKKLMISDYQSNKYNVQNEPAGVKQEIEYRLGLRERPKNQANNNADEELIKRVCRRMGVTYKSGMTQKQVDAAIKRKHPKMSDSEIVMMMLRILQEETQKMIAEGLSLSVIMSNSSVAKTADNYIDQLKKDHDSDFENIKCKRVDNVTFDINYAGKYIVRVSFYAAGPYKNGINISFQ